MPAWSGADEAGPGRSGVRGRGRIGMGKKDKKVKGRAARNEQPPRPLSIVVEQGGRKFEVQLSNL